MTVKSLFFKTMIRKETRAYKYKHDTQSRIQDTMQSLPPTKKAQTKTKALQYEVLDRRLKQSIF